MKILNQVPQTLQPPLVLPIFFVAATKHPTVTPVFSLPCNQVMPADHRVAIPPPCTTYRSTVRPWVSLDESESCSRSLPTTLRSESTSMLKVSDSIAWSFGERDDAAERMAILDGQQRDLIPIPGPPTPPTKPYLGQIAGAHVPVVLIGLAKLLQNLPVSERPQGRERNRL